MFEHVINMSSAWPVNTNISIDTEKATHSVNILLNEERKEVLNTVGRVLILHTVNIFCVYIKT